MAKTLVAYFSAGGATAQIARNLAAEIGADCWEIRPRTPYTAADLDWRNPSSRSSVEMRDRSARPEIVGTVENFSQYDTIFLGFPIWWYREPSIVDTFMETQDFSGKVVVPFATSGGSGMGKASQNLQALAPRCRVQEGRVFHRASGAELAAWARNYLR